MIDSSRLFGLLIAATLVLGAGAGAADAATKTVYAGPNAKLPEEQSLNDFYRRTVTIRQGDSVSWAFRGFHTIAFPARGKQAPPFLSPDAAAKYTAINDGAGAPFWFNGQPRLQLDPRSAFPQGGKLHASNRLTGSGLPLAEGEPKPYRLRFDRRGTFSYVCTVHPGMKGKVKVIGRGAAVPSAAQDRRAAKRQLDQQLAEVKRLDRFQAPAATVHGGSDKGNVALLKFFPTSVTIAAGQSVQFVVQGRQEPHTFSFGPEAYLKQIVDAQIAPVPGSGPPPILALDARALLPSDPPPALPPHTGANHGNGFLSTGILGRFPGSRGTSTAIQFTTAGSFPFICLIHPEMKATVVVQ